jgi:hypothetical protein
MKKSPLFGAVMGGLVGLPNLVFGFLYGYFSLSFLAFFMLVSWIVVAFQTFKLLKSENLLKRLVSCIIAFLIPFFTSDLGHAIAVALKAKH